MPKFHINRKGVPAPCKAVSGKCPLGGEENHYDTQEEAQVAADQMNESQHGLLPGQIAGDDSGKLTEQEELMRKLRDPNMQYKLMKQKTEESRESFKRAEAIFRSADNVEDRRIAGYDLVEAERELKDNEARLEIKAKELGYLDS